MKIIPVFAMALALSAGTMALSPKTKVTNPGANVQFAFCASGDSACESANRVRNDQNRVYANGSEGVTAVFNLISGSRDLTIGLNFSQRALTFDFRDSSYTAGAPAWWYTSPQQSVKPFMNVLGAYFAKEQCGTAATCNINYVTAMNAGQWQVSGDNKTYALLWNPNAAASRPVNSPLSTSPVNVNYIKDSSGERFIVTPLASAGCTPATACESDPVIAGMEGTIGRTVSAGGQYHMPFTLTVTLQ